MVAHWQEILVLSICLVACGYIAWRSWLALTGQKTTGCGAACGKCETPRSPLMQIDVAPRKSGEQEG